MPHQNFIHTYLIHTHTNHSSLSHESLRFMNVRLSSFKHTHHVISSQTVNLLCDTEELMLVLMSGSCLTVSEDCVLFIHPPCPAHSSGSLLKLSAGSADPSGYSTLPANLNVEYDIKKLVQVSEVTDSRLI